MQTGESLAARRFGLEHAVALLQPGDKTWRQKANDVLRALERPGSGRNGALGRKVEQPGSGSPAGPSGQTERVKHDSKHTNK
jgi:hypothetical protein